MKQVKTHDLEFLGSHSVEGSHVFYFGGDYWSLWKKNKERLMVYISHGATIDETGYRHLIVKFDKESQKWSFAKFKIREPMWREESKSVVYQCYDYLKVSYKSDFIKELEKRNLRFSKNSGIPLFDNASRFSQKSFEIFIDKLGLPATLFDFTQTKPFADIIRVENLNASRKHKDVLPFEKDDFYLVNDGEVQHFTSDEFFLTSIKHLDENIVITTAKDKEIRIYRDGKLSKTINTQIDIRGLSFLLSEEQIIFYFHYSFGHADSQTFHLMTLPFSHLVVDGKRVEQDVYFFEDFYKIRGRNPLFIFLSKAIDQSLQEEPDGEIEKLERPKRIWELR